MVNPAVRAAEVALQPEDVAGGGHAAALRRHHRAGVGAA